MLCEFPGTTSLWTPHLDGREKPPEWVAWEAQEEGKGPVDVCYPEVVLPSLGLSAQPGCPWPGGGRWGQMAAPETPQGAGAHSEARCERGLWHSGLQVVTIGRPESCPIGFPGQHVFLGSF